MAHDPFAYTHGFPYLHEKCEPLRGKPWSDGIHLAFCKVWEEVQTWLEKEYPEECAKLQRSYKNWFGPWPSPPEKGLRPFLSDEAAPSPHGGWPGEQWYRETSPHGQTVLRVQALMNAYNKVKAMRDEADARKAAEEKKRQEFLEEQRKKRLAWETQQKEQERQAQLHREAMFKLFIPKLCDSLILRKQPARIVRGLVKPAEWVVAFDETVLRELDRQCNPKLADDIFASARELTRDRAFSMLDVKRQEEALEQVEKDRRLATMVADIMLQRQQQQQQRQEQTQEPQQQDTQLAAAIRDSLSNPTEEDPS